MINTRKIGGGYCIYSTSHSIQKGGKALSSCSPIRLPKGGQRWDNTSVNGGVING